MNKTLTVNLGGTIYQIDEEAHRLLDNYLSNLKRYFRKQEGADEIVADIENRIAELFTERICPEKKVLCVSDVQEVINRMGTPEDFCNAGEELDEKKDDAVQSDKITKSNKTVKRRLSRAPDNYMLGGVAAGLATYFDWDVSWVRIIMLVLIFIPYSPVLLVYLIAWLIIPVGDTTEEKQRYGKETSSENGSETVANGSEHSIPSRTSSQKAADGFISVIGFIIKFLLIAIFCPLLVVGALLLIAALLGMIITLCSGGTLLSSLLSPIIGGDALMLDSPWFYIAYSALLLFVGIPLFAIVHSALRSTFRWRPITSNQKRLMLLSWLILLPVIVIFWFVSISTMTIEHRTETSLKKVIITGDNKGDIIIKGYLSTFPMLWKV